MKKILIADDAAFMRVTIKNMLEKNGYEVAGEAQNGQIAIQKYSELKPDIVTMDITMPEVDGLAALKAIMQLDPNAKIVMVSAMGQRTMVMDAVVAGAKGFIVKPFNEETLLTALEKI